MVTVNAVCIAVPPSDVHLPWRNSPEYLHVEYMWPWHARSCRLFHLRDAVHAGSYIEAYCRKVPLVRITSLLAGNTRDEDAENKAFFVRGFLSTALEIGIVGTCMYT